MNIFVGNLSRDVTEEDLRTAFSAFGQVSKATILKDKFSGEPRGFGFVEMATPEEAEQAISRLNGSNLDGRTIQVEKAKTPGAGGGERRGGAGRGGFGGGGGRGGGGSRPGRW